MVVQKLSVSLSGELTSVLRTLAATRQEDVSRLIETLLREHAIVVRAIQAHRDSTVPAVPLT